MQDNAVPVTLTRRAIREAERAAQRAVADPAILDAPTVPDAGRAGNAVPAARFGQTSDPTRAALRRAAKVDADGRAAVVVTDVPVPAALQVELAEPEAMSTVPAAPARWAPRVAVLGALGAVTIVIPLAGSQPVVSAAAPSASSAAGVAPGSGASARAMALVAPTPSVVDTLAGGGTPIGEAAALAADPTAATRAVTDASRAYLREALECPVQSGANGALSAVMGGEEVERLSMPVAEGRYRITSTYGYRTYPIRGMHEGTDFAGSLGTPLHAVADGVVTYAGGPRDGRTGNIIVITSEVDGQTVDFWYGHMYADGLFVRVGEEVTAGQVIGEIGNAGRSTGPHLHFEVHPGGQTTDPLVWLRANEAEPTGALTSCPA